MAHSTYLFAIPTFFEGAGRVVDFQGALNQYNDSPSGKEADEAALEHDVRAVIEDLVAGVIAARRERIAG